MQNKRVKVSGFTCFGSANTHTHRYIYVYIYFFPLPCHLQHYHFGCKYASVVLSASCVISTSGGGNVTALHQNHHKEKTEDD